MPSAAWESPGLRNEINVTPMIDVLLVLLILFMVFVQLLMRKQKQIDLQLPVPDERPGTAVDGPAIVLEVGPGGVYRINRGLVPAGALAVRLAQLYARRSEKILFVRGDPRARYQEVVTAMDI